jgi:4-hydroxy-tetrahydrodipicolinate synthase
MSKALGGAFVVTVTPLDERRCLDEGSYLRLLDYCHAAGVSGLTVLGESAERDQLSEEEKRRILSLTFGWVRGRLPVVVGTGGETVREAVESGIAAQDAGASAVMVPAPRRFKKAGAPDDDAIFGYFSAVADRIRIPMVVQDFPQSDRPKMSTPLIARLSREVSTARYLKLEDPPTPLKVERVRDETNGRMKIFSAFYGRDSYWDLVHGAVGVMTASPTPEYLVNMCRSFFAGDRRRALGIYLDTLPLVHYCSELGLAVRKEVLLRRGVIQSGRMKQRERELPAAQRRELAEVLAWVEERVLSSSGIPPSRAAGDR